MKKKNKIIDIDQIIECTPKDFTNIKTPLREGAFDISDDKKIDIIESHFREIMLTLGLDLNDDSLKDSPRRVAKMYVKELFSGLNPNLKPKSTLFKNNYEYGEMLVEKDISFYSNCEHHFLPIIGKAHIAYISSGNVIGLSKKVARTSERIVWTE